MEYSEIKPMTITQLAQAYGVSIKTVRKWLKPFHADINKRDTSRIFTVRQVQSIFDTIGRP